MFIAEQLEQVSGVLKALAHPVRLQIVLLIGTGEACVCHLEAVTGMRQAYLSQHLMGLRVAGILSDRRAGRFVYYRLVDVQWLAVIAQIAGMGGMGLPDFRVDDPVSVCSCPKCEV